MSDKSEVNNPSDLKKEEAEQLKNQANDHFKSIDHTTLCVPNLTWNINKKNHFAEKEYDKAIDFYTKAIELVPKNAVYYANRSLAHLRQESFGFALQDAVNYFVFFFPFFILHNLADNKFFFLAKKNNIFLCTTASGGFLRRRS